MERVTLSELEEPANRSGRLFLQTKLQNEGNEGFKLTVLDGDSVWVGSISEDDLDKYSEKLKMDFNTYVKETKAALTKEDTKDLNFECSFTKSANSAQLQWKKMPTDDIKYNLGSVTLKKCADSSSRIANVLSQCIADTQALQMQIQSLETDNERLALERQNALKRLDKCVTAKEELEKDLYSKFVLVLNSKKERIRSLLEGRDDGSLDASHSPVASTSRDNHSPPPSIRDAADKNGEAAKHKADGSGDDFDVNTDDDSSPPPKKQPRGTGKQKLKTLESSLNLGEDEDDDKAKSGPAARRPRRQAATKKQTPAKPILPRVSSGDTPSSERAGSVGKRSSLRKSGSNNSNKSFDNVDPDDLLDNF